MAENDPFDTLIQKGRGNTAHPARRKDSGISPVQLLRLPEFEREIISYLARNKEASLSDLEKAIPNAPRKAITEALNGLIEAEQATALFIDGQMRYRAIIGGRVTQSGGSFSQKIWSRLQRDSLASLQQSPLFKDLPQAELEALAEKATTKHYNRNEVIFWQGETGNQLILIKSGIVGITRLSPGSETPQILAYLKEGSALGTLALISKQSRTATATALSAVEALIIPRQTFMNLLNNQHSVALALAQNLGEQLIATNSRVGTNKTETRLVLLFRLTAGSGRTTISAALAATLAKKTGQPTVYTEYPTARNLPRRFGFNPTQTLYHHPANFDVLLPQTDPALPTAVRASLMLDDLLSRYTNIVIGLPEQISEGVVYMLERASQIILVAPPEAEAWQKLNALKTQLLEFIHPQQTGLFSIINRVTPQHAAAASDAADFDIPFTPNLSNREMPPPLAAVAEDLANRLGRTHQIGLYIPTTIEVNQKIDSNLYLERALAFMGQRFGGATSNEAQGVWNSEEAGLVGETVYIVRSYVTQADMNAHLDDVFAFVETLKTEMRQEAMAVEVDQKLMLI